MVNSSATTIARIKQQLDPCHYIQKLFDPVQTHGVYCVDPEQVDHIKQILRTHHATRFRYVKSRGMVTGVLCFKLPSN